MESLTPKQREEFEERGYLRVEGAFSKREARAMEERVWQELEGKHGALQTDPSTWDPWNLVGLQELRLDPIFRPIGGDRTQACIDALLGPDLWRKPRHWGQLLISFPSQEEWNVPTETWHTDFGFWPSTSRLPGLQLFSFITEVGPRGGGTAVISGSHLYLRDFVQSQSQKTREKMKTLRKALMQSDPWLHALGTPGPANQRIPKFMETSQTSAGVELRVCELTGSPGDIVLADPWLLHASTINASSHSRIMCVQRLRTQTAPTDEEPAPSISSPSL